MNLGQTIYRLRIEKNMSQGDLADALGVSRQSVSKWETNSSVPELDKLIKLSQIFEISLDALVKGEWEKPEKERGEMAKEEKEVRPTNTVKQVLGIVLICFGLLIWLLFTGLGADLLFSTLFSMPFFLCGGICLISRKHTGLWCGWAVFFSVNLYLRYATGITWRLAWLTLQYEPSWNYTRLAFAWLELICFLTFITLTVLRLGKEPLRVSQKNLWVCIAGWVAFLLLHIPVALNLPKWLLNIQYIFFDWCKVAFLTALLCISVRLLRGRKRKKNSVGF